uniref:Uncharacterized protein n=1 Tax=Cannabis sativa TaxID=3483 RepID=A0A803QGU1_CANSA
MCFNSRISRTCAIEMAIVLGVPVVDYPEKYLGLPCYTRDLTLFNQALLGKQAVRDYSALDSLVAKFTSLLMAGVIIRDTNGAVML